MNTECAAIPEAERVDCGWGGISRLECKANMCCYSSSGSSGGVPCYFKESKWAKRKTNVKKTYEVKAPF